MTLSTLTLVLDLDDGTGTPVTTGFAQLAPSVQLTGGPLVTQAPVQGVFRAAGAAPPVAVLPTDTPGLLPAGWAWQIAFQGVPGNPAAYQFFAPAGPVSFTASNASPAVFTWTLTSQLTSLPNGTGVQLSGGSLPAGFVSGTTYYVVNASGSTVQLAATQGGAPLASTSTGSGQLAVVQYNLSALSPVSSAVTMAAFMPAPSGTPSAGQVPAAAGSGSASAWTTAFGPVAATAVAGFALQNGTPNIITWTAPNDGKLHRFMLFASMDVTGAETGGAVQATFTLPDGNTFGYTVFTAGQGTGFNYASFYPPVIVKAGSTVTLAQSSALTAGAATLWAEIWAL